MFAREVGFEKVSFLTVEVLGTARMLYGNVGFEMLSAGGG